MRPLPRNIADAGHVVRVLASGLDAVVLLPYANDSLAGRNVGKDDGVRAYDGVVADLDWTQQNPPGENAYTIPDARLPASAGPMTQRY